MTCGGNPGNLRSDFPATGNYKFSLDTTDQANPELTVLPQLGDAFGATTTFVRGGFNDWGTGNPMIQVGDSAVRRNDYRSGCAGLRVQDRGGRLGDDQLRRSRLRFAHGGFAGFADDTELQPQPVEPIDDVLE